MGCASKRNSKRRNAVSSVPMAPMIDMVFLLLVFFMTVSSISQAGKRVELELPKSSAATVPENLSNRIAAAVDGDGLLYLNGEQVGEDEMGRKLSDLASGRIALKLRIRADADTEFRDIRRAMKIAAEAGISDIIYAAHELKR